MTPNATGFRLPCSWSSLAIVVVLLAAAAPGAGSAERTAGSLPVLADARAGALAAPGDADSLAVPQDEPVGTRRDARMPPPARVRRWQTGIVRPDRLSHASLALGIGVGVGMLRRSPATGAGAALGIGLAKELSDDRFDRGDLAADAVGAGLAALLVAALTR